MWLHLEGCVFGRYIEWYWQRPKLLHRLKYKLFKSYRKSVDDIPF